jgi:hypothetical protein
MGKDFEGTQVFIGIASCLALAGSLLFYGMQKNDNEENIHEYEEDKPLPELKYDDDEEVEEEILKPRIKRKYGTNKNYQRSKTTTKRNRYK